MRSGVRFPVQPNRTQCRQSLAIAAMFLRSCFVQLLSRGDGSCYQGVTTVPLDFGKSYDTELRAEFKENVRYGIENTVLYFPSRTAHFPYSSNTRFAVMHSSNTRLHTFRTPSNTVIHAFRTPVIVILLREQSLLLPKCSFLSCLYLYHVSCACHSPPVTPHNFK